MPTVIPGDEFILQDAAGSNNDIWIHDGDKWVRKTPAESLAILSGQAAASFSMNTQKITNVVDPTADQDAATKKYVDDNADEIVDADGDTKVQVEEAADEDKCRIDTGGTERALFSGTCTETYAKINKHSDLDGDTVVQVEESSDEDKIRMDVAGVEAFLLETDGELELAKQSRSKAYLSGAQQTIPSSHVSGTSHKVILDAEAYDEQNEMNIILSTGTTTSTTANKLVDSGATFSTDGIIVGAWVWNTTDDTYAEVTAIDSETTLSIDADIMVSGEGYKVYNSRLTIKKAGYYAIVGGVVHLSPVADKKMTAEIYKNGAAICYNQAHTSITDSIGLQTVVYTDLAANDYLELMSLHKYEVVKNIYNAERGTFLSVHRLS